jgi:hypothetical protein
MSYVGSLRRTTAWVRKFGTTPPKAIVGWILGSAFLLFMWVFLLGWYFVTLVIFGLFTIPYRFVRRGHRKQEHLQRAQLATMQAMLAQQQQAMVDNQRSEN